MDARFIKFVGPILLFGLVGCSNGDSDTIDEQQKLQFLSATSLMCTQQSCIPNQVLDEEDIAPVLQAGYQLNNNEYCLPGGSPNSGMQNCIPAQFIDENDLNYLLANGYGALENGKYCTALPESCGGDTTGGTTTGGSDAGGSVTGGTTTGGSDAGGSVTGGTTTGGSDAGGSVTGGTTTGGSDAGGSVTGGTTTGGSDAGGSVTGGTTTGGSDAGGSVTGGTTTGGSDAGGTTTGGSDAGGTTTGGSDVGGSVTGGTTTGGSDVGGSVTGGSDAGGSVTGGTTTGGSDNGGATSGGTTGGSTSGGSCNGGGTDGHENECSMNIIDPDDEDSYHQCKGWDIPVDRMCSKMRTGNGRYTILDRAELVLQVVKRVKEVTQSCDLKHDHDNSDNGHSGGLSWLFGGDNKCRSKKKVRYTYTVVCESRDTQKIKQDVLQGKSIDLSECDISKYEKKDLYVTLFSPVVGSDLPINGYDSNNVRFFKNDSDERGEDVLSFVMYGGRDVRYSPVRERVTIIVDNNPDGEANDPKHCDFKASPLIVHVNPDHDKPKYVQLSSQDDGILYNILGFNAEPKPHTKNQISWLDSQQYMFLVKPNKKGQVKGVDEMFGDNTKGPDNDFSANGFAALAKYDGMTSDGKKRVAKPDGIINEKDPVFSALRLWRDKNFDGISTPDELFKLKDMKVKAVDLRYDSGFYERDPYGNETVYKSVIQYQDGSLDLIFDLWFNYKK